MASFPESEERSPCAFPLFTHGLLPSCPGEKAVSSANTRSSCLLRSLSPVEQRPASSPLFMSPTLLTLRSSFRRSAPEQGSLFFTSSLTMKHQRIRSVLLQKGKDAFRASPQHPSSEDSSISRKNGSPRWRAAGVSLLNLFKELHDLFFRFSLAEQARRQQVAPVVVRIGASHQRNQLIVSGDL